jgi:hypothetical protein
MVERADTRITRSSGVNTWRAGCSGSCTSGSEGGPEKPTHREVGRALRSDPYSTIDAFDHVAIRIIGCLQQITALLEAQ